MVDFPERSPAGRQGLADVDRFAEEEGRRPRMMVMTLDQDGQDRGARMIAAAFADIGFDVDVGPLFQTPEEAARQAIENDVHVVGIGGQAADHTVPALTRALRDQGSNDIMVMCYGPGTDVPGAAAEILNLIRKQRMAA